MKEYKWAFKVITQQKEPNQNMNYLYDKSPIQKIKSGVNYWNSLAIDVQRETLNLSRD